MTTAKETACNCTEHDGTALTELFLNDGCPLGIGVQGGTTAVGTGLLDHAHGLLVIAEKLECIDNQDNTVDIDTATAGSAGTIGHVLGLANIAHQGGYGIGFLGGVVAGVGVAHVLPVEGDGRQGGHVHIGSAAPHRGTQLATIGRNLGSFKVGIFPVVEHHGGRGGGATRQALVSTDLALVPVGSLLVPQCGQQRLYAGNLQCGSHH